MRRALAPLLLSAAALAVTGSIAPAGATGPSLTASDPIKFSADALATECTIGFNSVVSGNSVAVTAGHCDPRRTGEADPAAESVPVYPAHSSAPAGELVSSVFDISCPADEGATLRSCHGLDYAVIALPGVPASNQLAPPPAVGSIVCKRGQMTGRTCGSVVEVTGTEIVARMKAFPGDSGAGLTDEQGRVVGVLSRARPDSGAPAGPLDAQQLSKLRQQGLFAQGEFVYTRADAIAARLSR